MTRSIDDCKNLCNADEKCIAVDYDTNTNNCYSFENAADLIEVNSYNSNNVNQYVKIPCVTATRMYILNCLFYSFHVGMLLCHLQQYFLYTKDE